MENINKPIERSNMADRIVKYICALNNIVIDREVVDEASLLVLENQGNSFSTSVD